MISRRLGSMGLVATGAMATLVTSAIVGGVGCSSSNSNSANAGATLRGEYDATEAGEMLAINFLDSTTYTRKLTGTCDGNAFCVEHGTYTVDTSTNTVTLKSSTGKEQEVPYSVLTTAPLTQSVAHRLHILGGDSLTGSGTSLTSGEGGSLTSGEAGSLTPEAGTALTVNINIALTITFGGQGASASGGDDNGDAGGNSEGGTPLTFDGGADLDSGDNGTDESDAYVDGGNGTGTDSATGNDGGSDNDSGSDAAADAASDAAKDAAGDSASSGSSSSSSGSSASSGSAASSGSSSKASAGTSSGAGNSSGAGSSSSPAGTSSSTPSSASDAGSAGDGGVCGSGNVNQQSSNATWSAYQPAQAISYADSNWSNGVGLCAQFTSASVTAGGVKLGYTWVPDIVTALSGVAYDEYSPSNTTVNAQAGDIVVYSNATGNDFCQTHSVNERNCGHVGLVVTAGNATTATADFHNGAHHHLGIKYILEGTTVSPTSAKYSTFRVYHVAALSNGCSGSNGSGS